MTQLLNRHIELKNQTICVNEYIPNVYSKKPDTIQIRKEIRFTFSRKNIEKNYLEIKTQLEEIVLQISNEVELIKNDNLARGVLVEAVNTSFDKKSNSEYYTWQNSQFVTILDEYSPSEYWGSLNYPTSNFVTDTEQYPWMPVTISDDKSNLPF